MLFFYQTNYRMSKTTYLIVGESKVRSGIFSVANERTYQRLQPVTIKGEHEKLDILNAWNKIYNKKGEYTPTMILTDVVLIPKNYKEEWKEVTQTEGEPHNPLED